MPLEIAGKEIDVNGGCKPSAILKLKKISILF